MIKVKLTKNYVGFNIEGTFDDFYELYDNILCIIGSKECENDFEEDMRMHILAFLYELRHGYQGSRNIKAVDNGLHDEQKKYYGISKTVRKDIVYDFDYVVPDLLTDILLFKHFASKYFAKNPLKKLREYDTNYNSVMAFYSRVLDALKEILTEFQVKKVKKKLAESEITESSWLKQWYVEVIIDYLKMPKEKRQKEMMHVVEFICDPNQFDDYHRIKKEVEQYAKEHDVNQNEVEYGTYPTGVAW